MRNESAIYNAVDNLSKDRTFHPVEEWMESIPWDGTDRFKLFAETLVIGNQKHEKWRNQIVRRWLIQGAAAMRNYKHGKTKDIGYVLTIQGEQGVGKSRWVSSLVPPAFVSLGLSLRLTFNERDTVRRVTQTFIGELAELDHSFKHSDVTSTKTFLTAPVDTYRDAYARTITSRPRCTVFIGTVNPAGFLLDQTGNRRFWPVAVERCLYNHGIDMQQVWAQAGVLQAKGEQHWLTDDEERMHTEVTARHMAASDVQDIISDLSYRRKMFTDKSTWVHQSGKDLCTRYLVHSKMIVLMDLQAAMDRLKFERAKIHGKRGWWVPPQTLLTAGQRADLAGLVLVKGGKVDETRK
jgi:putative DNA primase/helicase